MEGLAIGDTHPVTGTGVATGDQRFEMQRPGLCCETRSRRRIEITGRIDLPLAQGIVFDV